MLLRKHNSLKHADNVLKLVKKYTRKINAPEVVIESWSNGREQGYTLVQYPNKMVFSECRNSDQVLVIFGHGFEFDVSTNMPLDKLWSSNNRQYFDTNEDAAKFIAKKVTKDWKIVEE